MKDIMNITSGMLVTRKLELEKGGQGWSWCSFRSTAFYNY